THARHLPPLIGRAAVRTPATGGTVDVDERQLELPIDTAAPRAAHGSLRPGIATHGIRAAVVGVCTLSLVGITLERLTGSVSLFLSPDGAHYLAAADTLLGNGVRPVAHPPAFPLLVAAARAVVDQPGQVHVALAVSLGLFVVALYVLCRQFAGFSASIAGAGI